MVCVKCRAQIPDGISFCPKCGAAVVPEKRCPKCGSVIDADISFCTKCGTPLTGPAPTADSGTPGGSSSASTIGNGTPGNGCSASAFGNGAPGSGNGAPVFGNSAPAAGGVTSPAAKPGFRWWYAAAAVVAVLLLLFLGKAFVNPGASKNPAANALEDPYNGFINGTWTSEPAGAATLSLPDDYEVSILSARTSRSSSTGWPCIIVKYSFTNKSRYDQNFLDAVSWTAYQSDSEVAVVTDVDEPANKDLFNITEKVSSGETITVELAFSLAYRDNPVILIEIDDRDGNSWVQKKFTFVPDN